MSEVTKVPVLTNVDSETEFYAMAQMSGRKITHVVLVPIDESNKSVVRIPFNALTCAERKKMRMQLRQDKKMQPHMTEVAS